MEQSKNPESFYDPSADEPPERTASSPPPPEPPLPALRPPPAVDTAFDPVPLRYRCDGWTPERQRDFIEHLADTVCPETAAARVGMSTQSAYALRRRAGAEGFSAAWDAALRIGYRHRAAAQFLDTAINGRIVRRYYHGELIAEERVYSERLMLAMLDKFDLLFGGSGGSSGLGGDVGEAIARDWDGAMQRLESGALAGGYRVWKDQWGNWDTNFPPPPGFDNYYGDPADPDFSRPLTEAEARALEAQAQERVEAGEQARDAYFGFKPGRAAIYRTGRLKGRD